MNFEQRMRDMIEKEIIPGLVEYLTHPFVNIIHCERCMSHAALYHAIDHDKRLVCEDNECLARTKTLP